MLVPRSERVEADYSSCLLPMICMQSIVNNLRKRGYKAVLPDNDSHFGSNIANAKPIKFQSTNANSRKAISDRLFEEYDIP